MLTTNFNQLVTALLSVAAGCQTIESPERLRHSAFMENLPPQYRDTVPIGKSKALLLTRPKFSGSDIAHYAHTMAEIVVGGPLPPVEAVPTEQFESFEAAAAAVEGRVWLTIDTDAEVLEFDYYPSHPSIMVGVMDRDRPSFTEAGVYTGIGRDAALEQARRCADLLVESKVLEPNSYVREPILERAPSSRYPAGSNSTATIEVTDHYHFIFGEAPHGILLGNSELTIDVDAHSGRCFRLTVAFIDYEVKRAVDLIVSANEAKAWVENQLTDGGEKKVVDEGKVVYWLDPGVASAVVEPRYVSSYTIVSDNGLASHGISFAVSLSRRPPIVTEF